MVRSNPPLAFSCSPDNDLYAVLVSRGRRFPRFDAPEEAVDQVPRGAGLLIMADDYPGRTTEVDEDVLTTASQKAVRAYIEYPASLPEIEAGPPRAAQWERGIVASNAFEPHLQRLTILDLHGCQFVPMRAQDPLLAVGRVAGLDHAVYGLPKECHALLFKHPHYDALISSTKLSHFVTARYSPTHAWKFIWQTVLGLLAPGKRMPQIAWVPTVRPSYSNRESLPRDAERLAFRRGLEWFINSGLLLRSHAGGTEEVRKGVAGAGGLMEGFASLINPDGSQPMHRGLRTDCIGEGAGALSFGGMIRKDHPGPGIARNLVDYIFSRSILAQGPRADPMSPSFGLLSWGSSPPSDSIYYGDDNARAMLGMIAAISMLGSERWNELLLRCLLANLRTTGSKGFRGWRIEEPELQEKGWRHFHDRPIAFYAPHYEAYLWACYLWAFHQTQYEPFLSKTRMGIRMMMEAYPEEWTWTNGIAQERARMILPLAWLVRVDDTPQHREWLRLMGREVSALQDRCGAIREELGGLGKGSYGPPTSNEDYGKHEATVLQANGDPICDMLYTSNFAFLGLHEAAAATKEALFIRAEDRLAEFLCRIQMSSKKHPELDGAWCRAFDFGKWDYWGSSADAGWGVWSIESGWTQSWIVSVLAMRQMKTSLWDMSAGIDMGKHLKKLMQRMEA